MISFGLIVRVASVFLLFAFSSIAYAQNDPVNPRGLGKVLAQGENFTLYSWHLSDSCSNYPQFIMVYDVPDDYVFELKILDFRRLIYPVFTRNCPDTKYYKINVYFKNIRFGKDGKRYDLDQSPVGGESPFLVLSSSRLEKKDGQTFHDWSEFNAQSWSTLDVEHSVDSGLFGYEDRPWTIATLKKRIIRERDETVAKNDPEVMRIRAEEAKKEQDRYRALNATRIKERQEKLAAAGFSVTGLRYEETLTDILLGNFQEVMYKSNSSVFYELFSSYLESFGEKCVALVPTANRVELTRPVCTAEYVYRNGSRRCAEWEEKGIGIFADKELHKIKAELKSHRDSKAADEAMGVISSGGLTAVIMANEKIDAANDMKNLVRLNPCNSRGLTRFHENLQRYAVGLDPLPAIGVQEVAPVPSSVPKPAKPSDTKKNRTRKVSAKGKRI